MLEHKDKHTKVQVISKKEEKTHTDKKQAYIILDY